ncbi:hypothetical protein AWC38_SpisGene9989 [Stylophora pistillata]|uniref:Uncharacterized protein n=1 Tax=Stylophora pistillata TaxID=50429 RepID=A0A2B4S3Y6_STYPI|nr:hypothetical protein AWC38_SpisGene9989 [Stylophora pistillata]
MPPKELPEKQQEKPTTSQSQTNESQESPKRPLHKPTTSQSQTNLNRYASSKGRKERIRLEIYRPVIYAIVLHDGSFPFKAKDENVENGTEEQWKLCKVGFTQRSVNNKMKEVRDQIKKTYKPKNWEEATTSTLFALPFSAIDTNLHHDTEKRIREKLGKSVKKEKAVELDLPVTTEWVLTTQNHIDDIMTLIEKRRSEGLEADLDIFKEIKVVPVPPKKEQKKWLKEQV